ncbi:hypothetical protein BH23CHL8_BH23CHL8_19090 [soil metagenome]
MKRRLALLGGSIAALGAAVLATLRGRQRGKGGRSGKDGRKGAQASGQRARTGAQATAASARAATPAAATKGTEGPASTSRDGPPAADDLQAIKGIGAVMADRLREGGITSVGQVAAWSSEDVQDVATRLGIKPERITREDWVGQARAIGTRADS